MSGTVLRIGRFAALVCLAGALAGCGVYRNTIGAVGVGGGGGKGPNRVTINDVTFKSRLQTGGVDKRDMVITVRPVAPSPTGALEAGRYRATYYCLRNFGSSETDWVVGPDTPVETIAVVDDSITLTGSCAAR